MNNREVRAMIALSLVGAVIELKMRGEPQMECEVVNRVATLGRVGNTVLSLRDRATGAEFDLNRRSDEGRIESIKVLVPVVKPGAAPAVKEPTKAELAAQVASLTAENFALRERIAVLEGAPVAVATAEAAPAEAPAVEMVAEPEMVEAPVAEAV